MCNAIKVSLSPNGNGTCAMFVAGEFVAHFGGSFDAIRHLGARHPWDWSNAAPAPAEASRVEA